MNIRIHCAVSITREDALIRVGFVRANDEGIVSRSIKVLRRTIKHISEAQSSSKIYSHVIIKGNERRIEMHVPRRVIHTPGIICDDIRE